MISVVPTAMVSAKAPATGQSVELWMNEESVACGTGNQSRWVLTYQSAISEDPTGLPSLVAWYYGVTDSGADLRIREPQLLTWTQNLHALAGVARVMIPGLRPLSVPERNNLRQAYKKLFRKV